MAYWSAGAEGAGELDEPAGLGAVRGEVAAKRAQSLVASDDVGEPHGVDDGALRG